MLIMKLFKNKNKIEPLAVGLLMLGSLNLAHAQEDNYAYLVSIQDSTGEHLCNGSYIGDNQVLMSPNCRNESRVLPMPIPSSSDSAMPEKATSLEGTTAPIQSDDLIPIPLPGYPTHVAFTLPDGSQTSPHPISRTLTHAYSGDQIIAMVSTVPEGVESLTLAPEELISKLERAGNIDVNAVGRYFDTTTDDITVKTLRVAPAENCPSFVSHPLAKRLCLIKQVDDPFPSCTIDVSNKSTGVPIVYDSGSQKYLLGYKRKNTNFVEGCEYWAASSRYINWLNLTHAKQEGLSIATAYDLGSRPFGELTNVDITLQNQSADQHFNISKPDFLLGDYFSVINNNCHTLNPGDSCEIKVYGKPIVPIKQEDMLTFAINGKSSGTYFVTDTEAEYKLRGDSQSHWNAQGWSQSGNYDEASITFKSAYVEMPTLIRDKYLIDPKSVTVTYRATGNNQWLMGINMRRMGLHGDGMAITPLNVLPGTNNQWVTKTFDVTDPGTYQVSINRGLSLFNFQTEEFSVEISDICFNDCTE
jgi:archaellum component FlaF (FlaF/FlaG flagellin family)